MEKIPDSKIEGDESIEIQKQRIREYVFEKCLVTGVPSDFLEECLGEDGFGDIGLENLGYLLSLPYHLKKMRDDGITHLVISATSSIPYGFILKGLDIEIYPEQDHLHFSIYSTKATAEAQQRQIEKIQDFLKAERSPIIGVFDECASSFEGSQYNKRRTVSEIQTDIEKILSITVKGRYGTDTVYPIYYKGKIRLECSQHGDEGKVLNNLNVFSALDKDGRGNILTDNITTFELERGYKRVQSGAEGIANIDTCYRLADIARVNYLANPNSEWNPFVVENRKRFWKNQL